MEVQSSHFTPTISQHLLAGLRSGSDSHFRGRSRSPKRVYDLNRDRICGPALTAVLPELYSMATPNCKTWEGVHIGLFSVFFPLYPCHLSQMILAWEGVLWMCESARFLWIPLNNLNISKRVKATSPAAPERRQGAFSVKAKSPSFALCYFGNNMIC